MARLAAVAVLLGLLTLVSAPGAPTRDSAEKRYLRLTATRAAYEVAVHRDPTGWVGNYERSAFWQVRAIIAYNGSTVRILPAASLVTYGVAIHDTRKYNPTGEPWCAAAPAAFNLFQDEKDFFNAPRARASIGSKRLSVSPSNHIKWGPSELGACTSDQTLEAHLVNGALEINIPRPGPSLRQGGTYYCSTDYSHEDQYHTFTGVSKMVVTLAPFPAKELLNNQKRLLGMRGTSADPPKVLGPNGPYLPDPKPKNGKCT